MVIRIWSLWGAVWITFGSLIAPASGAETQACLTQLLSSIHRDASLLYDVSQGIMPRRNLPDSLLNRFYLQNGAGFFFDENTRVVREFGAMIVRSSQSTCEAELDALAEGKNSHTVTQDYGSIQEMKVRGELHTHPFDYPSVKDLSFSGRDLTQIFQSKSDYYAIDPVTKKKVMSSSWGKQLVQDYLFIVDTGSEYHVLRVENPVLARKYFTKIFNAAEAKGLFYFDEITRRYDGGMSKGKSVSEIYRNKVIQVIGKRTVSGMGFYLKKLTSSKVKLLNP